MQSTIKLENFATEDTEVAEETSKTLSLPTFFHLSAEGAPEISRGGNPRNRIVIAVFKWLRPVGQDGILSSPTRDKIPSCPTGCTHLKTAIKAISLMPRQEIDRE